MSDSDEICCCACGASRPTRYLNLNPGVEAKLYFCEKCYRCAEHAMDPDMVESRILLMAELAALKAQLAKYKEDARGKVYEMCDRHLNAVWPMLQVTYAPPPVRVCPICNAEGSK